MENKGISVVIPVYNESGALPELHEELLNVLTVIVDRFEIIYVNDGSTDDTERVLVSLANSKVINLRKNYGQSYALNIGFKSTQYNLIVSMDGDGQNDPKDIPKLVNKLCRTPGLDAVAGWRKDRQCTNTFRLFSSVSTFLKRILINDYLHDSGCTLRIYYAYTIKNINVTSRMHRFITTLLYLGDYNVGEIIVNDRLRVYGTSKYGYSKIFYMIIDMVHLSFVCLHYTYIKPK